MQQDLTKNVLRFDFHDGLINEVCPEASESAWVLNFKKGILSALQNTMMRFDVDFNTTETDVSGTCGVQYTLASTNNAFVTIRKEKDIRSCHSRFSTHSFLQTVPYAFSGGDNSVFPILDSQSHCDVCQAIILKLQWMLMFYFFFQIFQLTIDNHIYREIKCFERHQLIPFSKQNTGAVTTTTSSLVFKGEQHYSPGEFLDQSMTSVTNINHFVSLYSLSLPQMQRKSKSALLLPSITLLLLSLPMVKSRLLANSWSKCVLPVLPRYNVSSSIPSLNSCKPPNSWTTRHWANCCNVLTVFAPMESKFK